MSKSPLLSDAGSVANERPTIAHVHCEHCRRDPVAVVIMPLIVVVLTAVLGTTIGLWFQNRAFKRNELFRARLDRLMRLHAEAVDTLRDVDGARRTIRAYENKIYDEIASDPASRDQILRFYRTQNIMSTSLSTLKEAKLRLDALAVDLKGVTRDEVAMTAISAYAAESDQFITCVQGNFGFTRPRTCSEDYPRLIPAMQAVVTAHGTLIDNFVQSYQ